MRGIALAAILLLQVLPVYAGDTEIRIALRAHSGIETSLTQWQPTANYLSKAIPGYQFIMVPFQLNTALDQAVSRGGFHFVLTNPSATVITSMRYRTIPVATLVNKRQGKGYTQFGSVVFTRADRKDIITFADLKDKVFMAVDNLGFGGWQVAWLELERNGIDPFVDFKEMRFAGGLQQKVVFAVRDGKVDAGSVRTDMLERMAEKNEIMLEDYRVLGLKHQQGFPFLLSSRLYPEWAMSKTNRVSDELGAKVLHALKTMPPEAEAAVTGKYIGWVNALDYSPVKELLRQLSVGPYQRTSDTLLTDALERYWLLVIVVLVVVILFTAGLVLLLQKK